MGPAWNHRRNFNIRVVTHNGLHSLDYLVKTGESKIVGLNRNHQISAYPQGILRKDFQGRRTVDDYPVPFSFQVWETAG